MSIKITLDPGDLGDARSVLRALAADETAQLIANAAGESYRDDTLDWIAAGKSFTPRNGGAGLEGAIQSLPFPGGAEVSASKNYAGFVEFGTGPHVIKPKSDREGLKRNVPGGGYVLKREIHHPGSKPYPYFFADMAAREASMLAAARSVLASVMAEAA
ncbi:MAG: hypothetical protein EPN21_05090 [Methylococcaceae bacterium]|nr:MAG: hypothetical protein EPN21_05090 [Methylococcaceae bacterium]